MVIVMFIHLSIQVVFLKNGMFSYLIAFCSFKKNVFIITVLSSTRLQLSFFRKDSSGLRWVLFFQDTNGLLFKAIHAALGVSATNEYHVNSHSVPRKAKEAIRGITRLTHSNGKFPTKRACGGAFVHKTMFLKDVDGVV
ncbi:putative UTP-monosaccharide-1-phosphate uridylyltransferase [Helianthus annuus]|nr:putative UTP-monosaccharide-1-phosphate uridylyltransferase [Helianthus annuus]